MPRALLLTILFLLSAAHAADAPLGDKSQVLLDGYRVGSFTQMHQVYPSRIIARAGPVRQFQRAAADLSELRYRVAEQNLTLEDHFARQSVMGFLIIHQGKIVYETYLQGKTELDVFASWSMAKSVVSTLVGLAIEDGHIASVQDSTLRYVPQLEDSGYKDNSLEDLLQMTSGVEFIEDYEDTDSLEAAAWFAGVVNGQLPYNKTILWFDKRVAPPGSRYYYASIEPQVIGWITRSAVGKDLSGYLSEKIWQKLGAEQSAYWMLDRPGGMEISSCCISATLRDYGRLGQLFLDHGRIGEEQIIPRDWIRIATHPDPQKPFLHPGPDSERRSQLGYQYYWWLWPGEDRGFSAIGFGGQTIYVNPAKSLVIVQAAAWGAADAAERWEETHHLIGAITERFTNRGY